MSKRSPVDIGASVMDQIKSGKVQMRPRMYHVALAVVSVSAVIAASIAIAYLSSIAFFWLRIQTAETMAWGARANLNESIASFPWWAVIIATLLLFAAVVLVRRQTRLYKFKTRTVVLAIIAGALFLGFILSLFDIGKTHTPGVPSGRGPGQTQGWQQRL